MYYFLITATNPISAPINPIMIDILSANNSILSFLSFLISPRSLLMPSLVR